MQTLVIPAARRAEYLAILIGSVLGAVLAELAHANDTLFLLLTMAGAVAGVLAVRYRQRQREAADDARTARLMNALDAAAEADPSMQFEDDSFEVVLVMGLGCDKHAAVYPPPGHSYPRGDR